MLRITCPFCNFIKDLPEVPLKATKTTCPKCKKSFDLNGHLIVLGKIANNIKSSASNQKNSNINVSNYRTTRSGETLRFISLLILSFLWLIFFTFLSFSLGDGRSFSSPQDFLFAITPLLFLLVCYLGTKLIKKYF